MFSSLKIHRLRAELTASVGSAKADALMLLLLNHPFGDTGKLHDAINQRAALAAQIAKHSHNGKVRVEQHGRDCDGVQYAGQVHVIDATLQAYYRLYDDTAKWVDGPFGFTIVAWDANVQYRSRDLTLEAFEDGHAHCIHPTTNL